MIQSGWMEGKSYFLFPFSLCFSFLWVWCMGWLGLDGMDWADWTGVVHGLGGMGNIRDM